MERLGPRLEGVLEDYQRTYLASKNLAPRTRREYVADLRDFLDFLSSQCDLAHPVEASKRHLESYLAELDRRGQAGSTRRRKVASLRSLYDYLDDRQLLSANPARRLRPPAREHRQPRVLSEQEYRRLQDACRFHPRDQAIIELLLQTGIRLSELTGITLDDIELPARPGRDKANVGVVHVFGKGRRQRAVTLNWKACQALKSYLAQRPTSITPISSSQSSANRWAQGRFRTSLRRTCSLRASAVHRSTRSVTPLAHI